MCPIIIFVCFRIEDAVEVNDQIKPCIEIINKKIQKLS